MSELRLAAALVEHKATSKAPRLMPIHLLGKTADFIEQVLDIDRRSKKDLKMLVKRYGKIVRRCRAALASGGAR